MHAHTLDKWTHQHNFELQNQKAERRTRYVLFLTAITMVIEIAAGTYYGSMALLADGWHMGTHVAAFVIAVFAYSYARKHAQDASYSFGTGKVNVLGGFASAIALAVVSLLMLIESLERIVNPQNIYFNEAIVIATLGLLVNIVSAFILKDDHSHHAHDHGHDHHHGHSHEHHDHNLRAAYMHVLADALTSLLAIIALVSGKFLGWHWLDPMMGIVGAIIITRWAYGLLKQSSPILLDASIEQDYRKEIQKRIEKTGDNKISDLHVWKVGANHYAAIIALVTHYPKAAEYYKSLLSDFERLSHVTIEVNHCEGEPCSND